MNSGSQFTHLHCHTEYSLLDGAAKIKNLIDKAKHFKMPAIAITDHGNMFGVPQFVKEAKKQNITPIIGCEFYVANDLYDRKDKKRYHQIILAKNNIGYKNLVKLCSISYTDGYYYKPRIDKKVIKQYREGLMATTCCLGSEVCKAIINTTEKEAEECFLEWLNIWDKDYFIELQPEYSSGEQEKCNKILVRWGKKYNVPIIATNDVHYVEEQDSVAQDILICLQTGKDFADPNRLKFSSDQFFLKSTEQMLAHFQEIPEAVYNTQLVVENSSPFSLERDILIPLFQVPQGFNSQFEYLQFLTYQGARRLYEVITPEIETRIRYELDLIKRMGFDGYFLIVQDFINAAKKLNVAVGPGRGSAVGSIVSYCLDISSLCPIKYNLIFERFLNPERVSMPDIDIDFDDKGRDKVIQYVVDKYGRDHVAQIVTFGTMGAKSAIRDVARVLGLPLAKANYMAKLIPDKPGFSLAMAIREVPELKLLLLDANSQEHQVIKIAETLEGSTRHTGIHAAGIIIAPDDITDFLPIKTDKDSNLLVTQYEWTVMESVGMLKIDFLGLKSLSILHDALALIRKRHSIDIDINKIPLDDEKTFRLYQNGETVGTFQFESEGMRQWLIKIHPTNVEDLIALNALYRPGPMQFLPNYVARKHGKESVEYPHPILESVTKDTYGIMIYQEQIIQTAQEMAGYTAGAADVLRKAMGKKIVSEMENQKSIFINGAKNHNNIGHGKAKEVFEIMAKFAQYGFNRSHAAAYAILAYQTSYIKANYPLEYMTSILLNHHNDIDKISFFAKECKKLGIQVLGPSINESDVNFYITDQNTIRFGLSVIKGIGTQIAETIVQNREDQGNFLDIHSLLDRVPNANKKVLEALALSGSFDDFKDCNRRQYIYATSEGSSFLEETIRYNNVLQKNKNSNQISLFGNSSISNVIAKPKPPKVDNFSVSELLQLEKEMIGFYLSGHILDEYSVEINSLCNATINDLNIGKKTEDLKIACIVSSLKKHLTKKGRAYFNILVEDFGDSYELRLFNEKIIDEKILNKPGAPIILCGNLIPGYSNPEELELKVKKIVCLQSWRDQKCKKYTLHLDLSILNKKNIALIRSLVNDYKGEVPMEIFLHDFDVKEALKPKNIYYISHSFDFTKNISGIEGVFLRMHE